MSDAACAPCDDEGDGGGVGAYLDGGVVMGSGEDEGGAMGPAAGGQLPERLTDLL